MITVTNRLIDDAPVFACVCVNVDLCGRRVGGGGGVLVHMNAGVCETGNGVYEVPLCGSAYRYTHTHTHTRTHKHMP